MTIAIRPILAWHAARRCLHTLIKFSHVALMMLSVAIGCQPAVAANKVDSGLIVSANLRKDLAQVPKQGALLLVVAMSHGCHFCDVVKQNYIRHLPNDPRYRGRVVIRVVNLDQSEPLVGFDGKASTHRRVALALGAKAAPTLFFLNSRGVVIGDPLVGGDGSGFYAAYLEAGLDRILGAPSEGR